MSITDPPEEASPVQVEVHVWVGTECRTIFTVPPGEYLLGSDPSCHLCIDFERVERMHARLSFLGHRLRIEDLESEGGVFIGGSRISLPTPIQPFTEVHIGAARLSFEFSAEALKQIFEEFNDPILGLESIRAEISQDPLQVTGTLGEGGMGLVLKARDQRVHRSVAMKVLKTGNEFSPEKLLRFVGEAQLTGQLEHPNIVPVYQLGISSTGQAFYTMKHVRGQTLESVLVNIRRGDPQTCREYPLPALITVFQKVADAIAFAHSHGVIHRDLKPGNIMMGHFGEVLVMDWGLAKRIAETPVNTDRPANEGSSIELPSDGRFKTLQGAIVGTPPYLSPEQAGGGARIDQRSDIFVLGVILYEILSLRPPIALINTDQVVEAILADQMIPLRERVLMPDENGGPPPELLHCTGGKLPDGYSAVVSKAMRYNPSDRYQNVEELQADLTACQNGYPASAEEAGWIRQLQLLLGRRRREALIVVGFLIFSQLLLTYFLSRIAKDRRNLRASETALAESNQDLKTSNQRLEQIVYQLRNTAEINYRDAEVQLRKKRPTQALAQINLALVGGVAESGATRARYLIIRGHANTQLGFYTEALEDYRQAAAYAPDSIPFDEIEKDLTKVLDDGMRPTEGWAWEKIDVPNTGKLKQQLKSVNDVPPVKKPSPDKNATGQEN